MQGVLQDTFGQLKTIGTQVVRDQARTVFVTARPIIESGLGKLRNTLQEASYRSESQSNRMITRLLILKYAMGLPVLGPMLSRALETQPEVYPLKVLADIVGCLELHLQDATELTIPMVLYSMLADRVGDVLSDLSTQVDSLSEGVQRLVQNVLDNTEVMLSDAQGEQPIMLVSPEVKQEMASFKQGVLTIVTRFRDNVMGILGEGDAATCSLNQMVEKIKVSGGAPPRTHVLWRNRTHRVHTDQEGQRYLQSQKTHVYLANIRGQYRYKK